MNRMLNKNAEVDNIILLRVANNNSITKIVYWHKFNPIYIINVIIEKTYRRSFHDGDGAKIIS